MQITQEIQMSLQDERDMERVRKVILEREKLIEVIRKKNSAIQYYIVNSKTAKLVVSVLRTDTRLIEHIHSQLDGVLVFVSNLENALKEENFDQIQNDNQFKTLNLKTNSSSKPILVGFGDYNINSEANFKKESVSYLKTSFFKNKNIYKNVSRLVCSFSKWDEFIKKIELRISVAFEDLKRLNQIEQDKESINSKLAEIYFKRERTSKFL